MIVVLEQDLELVVAVEASAFTLNLFDKRGQIGSVALLLVMWRDVLPIRSRKDLG